MSPLCYPTKFPFSLQKAIHNALLVAGISHPNTKMRLFAVLSALLSVCSLSVAVPTAASKIPDGLVQILDDGTIVLVPYALQVFLPRPHNSSETNTPHNTACPTTQRRPSPKSASRPRRARTCGRLTTRASTTRGRALIGGFSVGLRLRFGTVV
ncbi:hypothetical protein B0T24DRAFT_641674 [Lasiosphaeria ovina]|uniref:Uncharacterized protein n=1 Tax=Lasiosphaeria ovina TaxID=92902 RepID=A0AAE0MYC4_9PEZI|nr:hypothetical protein B0T24DRAFT_641674 [Lasiosphaeria ovina]